MGRFATLLLKAKRSKMNYCTSSARVWDLNWVLPNSWKRSERLFEINLERDVKLDNNVLILNSPEPLPTDFEQFWREGFFFPHFCHFFSSSKYSKLRSKTESLCRRCCQQASVLH